MEVQILEGPNFFFQFFFFFFLILTFKNAFTNVLCIRCCIKISWSLSEKIITLHPQVKVQNRKEIRIIHQNNAEKDILHKEKWKKKIWVLPGYEPPFTGLVGRRSNHWAICASDIRRQSSTEYKVLAAWAGLFCPYQPKVKSSYWASGK